MNRRDDRAELLFLSACNAQAGATNACDEERSRAYGRLTR